MSDLARRMINLLACRTTLPGRAIRAKRTAFRRLLAHWPPNVSRFIAEFRACPVAPYGVEGQHRYGPPCCVGPKQPRREPASGQIILQNAVDLLPFAAPLPARACPVLDTGFRIISEVTIWLSVQPWPHSRNPTWRSTDSLNPDACISSKYAGSPNSTVIPTELLSS